MRFTEGLLCARYSSRYSKYNRNKTNKDPGLNYLQSTRQRERINRYMNKQEKYQVNELKQGNMTKQLGPTLDQMVRDDP